MDDEEKFRCLIAKAKEHTRSNSRPSELRKGLAYYKQAFIICQSDKLNKRITKLETYLEQVEDSDDDDVEAEQGDGEEMAHVGNGFYIYKELYDKLYAHQREGVLFFWKLWNMKKGGILGDDMGLGKTIQVCAFLAGMFDAGRIKSVLIVVPVVVIINWMNEFQKWAPGIDVYDYHDQSKKERERALRRIQQKGGVCLTSYGIVVNNAEVLSAYNGREFVWDYVILDEGHKIKNPTTKSAKAVHLIPAKNRIVLSGTPLMNNLKELWALFDWTHAGQLLGSAKTFTMEFDGPITRAREKDGTAGEQRLGVEMSKNLRDIIAPYFLRRSKTDVIQKETKYDGSAPHMPTMTRKNDLICWVYLSEIQEKIYRDFLQTDEVREFLSSTRSPLTALTVLKKICDHPRLMTNRQCEHLGLTIADGIDLDRLDAMVAEDTAHFSVNHIPDELLIKESGKMVFLVKLLDNLKKDGHRCLVFSQSRKVLNVIQKVVQNRGHRICRLDGTIRQLEERQKIIDRFMTDNTFTIFLLTTQVGGVGLTLTAADRVVIFDPSWNPATDSQAVDRAFRIGQDKNVVVYRLITCGSIEEKIYRRQIFKDSINRMTTGDTKNPFRYFTKQDLKELFELSDIHVSSTQQQLEKLQQGMRKTDTLLDEHIAFLYSLEMFGISDHDLMFEIHARKEVEGEADVNDRHGEEYIRIRALKACQTLTAESEANMDLVKKLGKYPGPQNEDVAKLFKPISSVYKAAEGSSQPLRRNFPMPTPQFTLADVFDPVLSSTLRVEEKLEELELDDEEITEPRYPTPPTQSSSVDHSYELQNKIQQGAHSFFQNDKPSSAQTSFYGLVPDETALVEVCQKSPLTLHESFCDNPTNSPFAVVKESMVISPMSSKPLLSMEVAEEEHDELLPMNKLNLLESSPKVSFSASWKRRSSFFRQCGSSSEGRRMLNSEVCQATESPVDSPAVKTKKLRRLIISSDEEEEDASATQLNPCQAPERRDISAQPQLANSEHSVDGNTSAMLSNSLTETDKNATDSNDGQTDEQLHPKHTEENVSCFSDGGIIADEQRISKACRENRKCSTSYACMIEFECAIKKTREFLQQEDYSQAFSECRKALEICPGHEEAEKLSSKLFHLLYKDDEDVELIDDDGDDDDGAGGNDGGGKERDELLAKTTETGDKHESDEDREEEEEEEGQQQNEASIKSVDYGDEESEDEDSADIELIENLVQQGKVAYRTQNFEDALVCFTEADKLCGGSSTLQKYIERIHSHLKTSYDDCSN